MKKIVIAVFLWLSAVLVIFFVNLKWIIQNYDMNPDFVLQYVGSNDLELQMKTYKVTGDDAFLIFDIGEEKDVLNGKMHLSCTADHNVPLQIFYAGEDSKYTEKNSFRTCIPEGNDFLVIPFLKNKIKYIRVDFCVDQYSNPPMIDQFYAAERKAENYWNAFWAFYHVGFLGIFLLLMLVIVGFFRPLKICSFIGFWVIAVLVIFCLNLGEIESGYHIGDDYELKMVLKNNIEENTGNYRITGDDAFLVFDLGEEKPVFNGKVYFTNKCKKKIQLQIFRAGEDFKFKEEKSYYLNVMEGESSCILPLSYDDIRYVRVDICEKESQIVPGIGYVAVSGKNANTYFNAFLNFYNSKVLILLLMVCIMMILWLPAIKCFAARHEYFSTFLLLSFCVALLYGKYICGNVYYIFNDIARDSVDQVYPNLLHMADRIKNGEWDAGFHFLTALGDEQGTLLIGLDNWIALFGREHIAYLMGLSQAMKVVLAGFFAYRFARLFGMEKKQGLLVAIGYAFNAEFIIRGAWSSYPNLALLLMIWLTAYEYTHVRHTPVYLPVATILFFYSLDLYFCLFWGTALGIYIVFREFSENEASKDIIIRCLKIEGIYSLFALLGSMDMIVNKISNTVSSGRLNRNLQSFGSMRILAGLDEIMTAFLRTVGTSICGITWDYKGYPNFLDGAAFYCGILLFMFIPVSVYHMPARKRKAYLFGVVLFFIYLAINPVRFMINGFGSNTYKLNALCGIVFMILIAMHGLKTFFSVPDSCRKENRIILNATTIVLIGCLVAAWEGGYVARTFNWQMSIGFILLYDILLNLLLSHKFSRVWILNVLCACVMTEAVTVSWDCVNDRTVAVKEQVMEGGYYDNNYQKAIDYIKTIDSDFYRLEKKSGSVFLCDPLAQNYYGTTAYVGGIGVGMGLADIYDKMGLPHESEKYLYGSGENIYADALFGVKYYLIENGKSPDVFGLSFMTSVEGVDIYKNELSLPLAYMCDTIIPVSDFMKYSEADRRKILLESCVLEDKDISKRTVSVSRKYKDNRERNKVYALKTADNEYCMDLPENSVLIVVIDAEDNDLSRIWYMDQEGKTASRYFHADSENEIEICADVAKVWFEDNENTNIHNIEFYYQNTAMYYKSIVKKTHILQEKNMQMQCLSANYMKGRITCENAGVLTTSIPYGTKWKVTVDGNEVKPFKVNTGFIGIELALGEHEVEFIYEHNSWLFDNKFKCIGLFLALLLQIVLMGRNKKERKRKYR